MNSIAETASLGCGRKPALQSSATDRPAVRLIPVYPHTRFELPSARAIESRAQGKLRCRISPERAGDTRASSAAKPISARGFSCEPSPRCRASISWALAPGRSSICAEGRGDESATTGRRELSSTSTEPRPTPVRATSTTTCW